MRTRLVLVVLLAFVGLYGLVMFTAVHAVAQAVVGPRNDPVVFSAVSDTNVEALLTNAAVSVPVIGWDQDGVAWIGHPVVSDNEPYTPSQGWLSDVVVGLRKDGVVVWKKVKRQ